MGTGLIAELKRRNVFRMAGLYLAASWLVIEIASTLLPIVGAPDWVERVLVLLLALGLVPALLFAWAYELTPEGLRRDGEVTPEQSIGPQTGRRMDRAIIAVLLLAVAYLVVDKFVLSKRVPVMDAVHADIPARSSSSNPSIAAIATSIAVLPLVNDSGDEDQQYFSDGLSEDLITALSSFDGLKVIGRNSSFQFRDGKTGSRSIGEQLGVSHLLEGSVRRVGDVVRITTTLVNAADGSAVWSQRYDRPYDNLFALQDEITTAVADALQARLLKGAVSTTHIDRPPSGNLEAYEAALQAKHLYRRANHADTRAAVELLRKATRLDPDYAYAWATLAAGLITAWGHYDARGWPGGEDAVISEAKQASARALELRPELPIALLVEARLQMMLEGDYTLVEDYLRRAQAIAPHDISVLADRAGFLRLSGRLEEAVSILRQAVELDPLATVLYDNMGLYLIGIGDYREGESKLKKVLELAPESDGTRANIAIAQILDDRPADAVHSARREPEEFWRRYALAMALYANGEHAASDAELAWMTANHAGSGAFQIAQIHAQRGDADAAFHWLDQVIETRDPGATEIHMSPFLKRFSDDPRFDTFLKRAGLPPAH